MILMNNVFLTHTTMGNGGQVYFRGNLPQEDKMNIYKYALASMAKMYPWKKAIIYFSLDEPYVEREKELIEFIEKEYSHVDLILRNKRNEYVQDWINTYELLDDELIYFCCNHDHVFIEKDTDYTIKYFDAFRKMHDCNNEFSSIYFTHWPEVVAQMFMKGFNLTNVDGLDMTYFNTGQHALIDSVQVLTNALYKEWWMNGLDKNLFFPRSDHKECIYKYKTLPSTKVFVPLKEICRHFDAYCHINPPISLNDCPALSIPNGFFNNDIKLSFGKKTEGYTSCDPTQNNYFCFDENGVDYKFDKNNIPFFWNGRVSEIVEHPYSGNIVECQKQNILNVLYGKAKQNNHILNKVKSISDKVLNLYDL